MIQLTDHPTRLQSEWRPRPIGVKHLYIHIPFCHRRCAYCDFNTYEGQDEFSNVLAQGGTPPERLEIDTVCTFDADNVKVSSMELDIRARVPGIDEEGFQDAVAQAEQGCPVSNALRGNVEVQVNASLEG